jgi:alpha/beta hydrolase fold
MTTLAHTRTGAGAPLVLLHGLGSSRRAWDPVIPALAGRFDVIAVDLPGFGDSGPLPPGTCPRPRPDPRPALPHLPRLCPHGHPGPGHLPRLRCHLEGHHPRLPIRAAHRRPGDGGVRLPRPAAPAPVPPAGRAPARYPPRVAPPLRACSHGRQPSRRDRPHHRGQRPGAAGWGAPRAAGAGCPGRLRHRRPARRPPFSRPPGTAGHPGRAPAGPVSRASTPAPPARPARAPRREATALCLAMTQN